ncbi:hypothetical protein L484_004961 [Morus notabilis]|uniref:Uncharacterized protein n=1 Tax=Morus notabilis TaxID=981085 RepID=W9QSJ9_9ROSA|nr:hypothetical protein L484_004961 [Morus notabilis]
MQISPGSIPPSRRRSLFILATSMILFSLKAYNIVSLVHVAKAAIRDKMSSQKIAVLIAFQTTRAFLPLLKPTGFSTITSLHRAGATQIRSAALNNLRAPEVDPFLRLVEDHKLQAVNSGSKENAYGSKEDDGLAMKSLSEIQITEDQTREFFASEIVKSLEDLSDSESSTIRHKLLNDFIPDDVCPLGSQLLLDTPEKLYQVDLKSSTSKEAAPLFSIDEDSFADSFDSHKNHSEFAVETPSILSVNQLLESVSETTHQVGRVSVSTGPDVPYKEMALHCEALLMGKQKKMSGLISGHQRQEYLTDFSYHNQNDESKAIISASYVDVGYLEVNNFTPNACKPSVGPALMLCATEYQHHPQFFKLPASSPYDNFLKAAGC